MTAPFDRAIGVMAIALSLLLPACGPILLPQPTPTPVTTVGQLKDTPRTPLQVTRIQGSTILTADPIPGYATQAGWLAFDVAPDRKQIALVSSTTVELRHLPSMDLVWTTALPAGSAYGFHALADPPLVAFSSDGTHIAWISGRPGDSGQGGAHVAAALQRSDGGIEHSLLFQPFEGATTEMPTWAGSSVPPTAANPSVLVPLADDVFVVANVYELLALDFAAGTLQRLDATISAQDLTTSHDGWTLADGQLEKDTHVVPLPCAASLARYDVWQDTVLALCSEPGQPSQWHAVAAHLADSIEIREWSAPERHEGTVRVLPDGQGLVVRYPHDDGDVMAVYWLDKDGKSYQWDGVAQRWELN